MKKDLEIDLLRSFLAVAAHRNFTQAARAVGRTQSAVSLQIKRLEDIVGERPFDRSRQSVSITHVGEALLVYANRILTANDAALSHIQRPEAEGLVRLGAPDDYATYLLPPIMARIRKDHPRLRFEISCDNADDLLGRVARYEPLHWVAAPDHVDDPNTPLSLVLFPSGCVCRDIALNALRQIDRPWHIAYSTRSIGVMEQALLECAGVSVMEASVIPPGLKIIDGQSGFPPLSEVAISVHRSQTGEAHITLVADLIAAKLGQAPDQQTSLA